MTLNDQAKRRGLTRVRRRAKLGTNLSDLLNCLLFIWLFIDDICTLHQWQQFLDSIYGLSLQVDNFAISQSKDYLPTGTRSDPGDKHGGNSACNCSSLSHSNHGSRSHDLSWLKLLLIVRDFSFLKSLEKGSFTMFEKRYPHKFRPLQFNV